MAKSRDAFRTISEVAEWLDIQAHVLRFWESKFTQVKPVKRAGGRRYYRPQDMMLLGGIKKLLHEDGMTIKGAQKLLREQGVKHVSSLSHALDDDDTVEAVAVEVPAETPVEPAAELAAVVTPLFEALPEQSAPEAETAEAVEISSEDVTPEATQEEPPADLFAEEAPVLDDDAVEETPQIDTQSIDEAATDVLVAEVAPEGALASETVAEPEVAAQTTDDATDASDETQAPAADIEADPDETLEDFVAHLRRATHIHPAQAAQAAALAARFAALYAPELESA
ncbi:MAG: MerR family transcriptional regulator [Shimia sp.]|jgi:DNA-binding transcriptional MerR regulator|uniref:MerR family transcriptional regulator n=1 Tax=Shimia sp. TaxID=1954381 RepID=UPI004058C278